MYRNDCLLCKIAQKIEFSHIIWENENYMAFLSIFPNTPGVTVVIPKEHCSSYYADVDDRIISELMIIVKKVSLILDEAFDDVARTAMVFEGFGIDHLHAKLYPMHGTKQYSKQWESIASTSDVFFEKYPGYITTENSHFRQHSCSDLAELAQRIRDISKKQEGD